MVSREMKLFVGSCAVEAECRFYEMREELCGCDEYFAVVWLRRFQYLKLITRNTYLVLEP